MHKYLRAKKIFNGEKKRFFQNPEKCQVFPLLLLQFNFIIRAPS